MKKKFTILILISISVVIMLITTYVHLYITSRNLLLKKPLSKLTDEESISDIGFHGDGYIIKVFLLKESEIDLMKKKI